MESSERRKSIQSQRHQRDCAGSARSVSWVDDIKGPFTGFPGVLEEELETLHESVRSSFSGFVLMNQGKPPESTSLAHLTVARVVPTLHEVVFVLKVSLRFLVLEQEGSSQLQRVLQQVPVELVSALPIEIHVDSDRILLLVFGRAVP